MDGWTPYFWNIRIGYELHSDDKRCENACGGIIDTANGTITSPSFPDIYPRFIFTLIIITTTVINIVTTTVIDTANGTITSPSFPDIYPRLLLSSHVPSFPGIYLWFASLSFDRCPKHSWHFTLWFLFQETQENLHNWRMKNAVANLFSFTSQFHCVIWNASF